MGMSKKLIGAEMRMPRWMSTDMLQARTRNQLIHKLEKTSFDDKMRGGRVILRWHEQMQWKSRSGRAEGRSDRIIVEVA